MMRKDTGSPQRIRGRATTLYLVLLLLVLLLVCLPVALARAEDLPDETPAGAEELPDGTEEAPDGGEEQADEVSDGGDKALDGTEEAPDGGDEEPAGTEEAPDGGEELPDETTDDTDEAPAGTDETPNESPGRVEGLPNETPAVTGSHPMGRTARSIHDDNEGGATIGGPARVGSTLPSSYDLRNQGFVCSASNQNVFSTCWALASIASAESSLLVQGYNTADALDLSERHLAYFTYHEGNDPLGNLTGDRTIPKDAEGNEDEDLYLSIGGNAWLAGYALSTWSGAVNESQAPYDELVRLRKTLSGYNFYRQTDLDATLARTEDTAQLTALRRVDMNAHNDIKQSIIDIGAAVVSMEYDDSYYNENTTSYYCAESDTTNHDVVLIGWDDNYPRENFGDSSIDDSIEDSNELPANNGAWLARNNWGTEWGDGGCFWISYEDASLYAGDATAHFFTMAPAGAYDHLYQYDGGESVQYNFVDSGGSIANEFVASGNPGGAERIDAVSFWMDDVNVNVSLQIYTSLDRASDPTSGIPAFATPIKEKTSYEGYYTIVLPNPVYVRESSRYAVVLTLTKSNGTDVSYAVDASSDYLDWVTFESAVRSQQSFERDTAGASWNDLATATPDYYDEPACCARIKAFTNDVPLSDVPAISLEGAQVTLESTKLDYSGKPLTPAVKSVKLGGKTLKASTDYTVSYTNNVKLGTATAIVKARSGSAYTGQAKAAFYIKKKQPIVASDKQVLVGKSVSLNAKSAEGALSYQSSNKAIATVNAKGVVVGKKAGTATIIITAAKTTKYWSAVKKVKVVVKLANPLTAKARVKTVAVKAATVKSRSVLLDSNLVVTNKAKSTLTYSNVSTGTPKSWKISVKTGKISVPKGTKKGTYTFKVKVTAAARGSYAAGSKIVSYVVKVS